ncbi:MAG: hypothetical protein ACYDBV_14180 [Nitrospiria bacterium]
MKQLLICLLVLLGLTLSSPSRACKSAGPNNHVGIITAIDLKGHTLTLKDAETGAPMVFKTADYLLKTVKVNQEVMITYEKTGKQMTATKIKA